MFNIKRQGEDIRVHALIQNIADVPGGVTIAVADLVNGAVLAEGSCVGLDSAGVAHVLKAAAVVENADTNATTFKISKGSHFKAGDFVTDGTKSVKITAVDTSSSKLHDVLTVALNTSVGLGALKQGAVLEQAKSAADATLAIEPLAMVAESYIVKAEENLWVPAVVIGTFKKAFIPPISQATLAKLKGIVVL